MYIHCGCCLLGVCPFNPRLIASLEHLRWQCQWSRTNRLSGMSAPRILAPGRIAHALGVAARPFIWPAYPGVPTICPLLIDTVELRLACGPARPPGGRTQMNPTQSNQHSCCWESRRGAHNLFSPVYLTDSNRKPRLASVNTLCKYSVTWVFGLRHSSRMCCPGSKLETPVHSTPAERTKGKLDKLLSE